MRGPAYAAALEQRGLTATDAAAVAGAAFDCKDPKTRTPLLEGLAARLAPADWGALLGVVVEAQARGPEGVRAAAWRRLYVAGCPMDNIHRTIWHALQDPEADIQDWAWLPPDAAMANIERYVELEFPRVGSMRYGLQTELEPWQQVVTLDSVGRFRSQRGHGRTQVHPREQRGVLQGCGRGWRKRDASPMRRRTKLTDALDLLTGLLGLVDHRSEVAEQCQDPVALHWLIDLAGHWLSLRAYTHLPPRGLAFRDRGCLVKQLAQTRKVVSAEHYVSVEVEILARLCAQVLEPGM